MSPSSLYPARCLTWCLEQVGAQEVVNTKVGDGGHEPVGWVITDRIGGDRTDRTTWKGQYKGHVKSKPEQSFLFCLFFKLW